MNNQFWDFDENKNYVSYKYNNNVYKVLNYKDSYKAAQLLIIAKKYINDLLRSINRIPKNLVPGIHVLLTTPFHVQEMQESTTKDPVNFIGLNKPKDVINTQEEPVGPDKSLRAKKRLIFLTLRDARGNVLTLDKIKPLIIHEITHTACNHVTFREKGNHARDFDEYHGYINVFK